MRFGITSSATQTEGGNNRNSWWEWASQGKIADDSDPYVACEHYKRVQEDAALIEALGVKDYRMGVDWARIEPNCGEFSEEALAHYADEIRLLKSKGIAVTVTLHHFANPSWFEHDGGFEKPDCWLLFARYAETVAKALYGLVTDFVTFNEPNTYVTEGYILGAYPPGVKKVRRAKKVLGNLCACHIFAYRAIHGAFDECNARQESPAENKAPRVGAALQFKIMQPKYKSSISDLILNSRAGRLYQKSLVHAMLKGIFLSPVRRPKGLKIPRGKYYDFVGVNYFTRSIVNANGHDVKEDVAVTDTGAEIYAQGLGKILRSLRYHFGDGPYIIAANGVADRRDAFRSRFIYEHVKAIEECGVPVETYYYYTLMDCFEWLDGISAKYGLYETDFGSQERRLRKSGEFYRELTANGGTSDALYKKYVQAQEYGKN